MVFFFWVCVFDKTRCGFWSIILPIIFETVSKIGVFFYFLIQSWIQFYPEHTGFPIVGGGGQKGGTLPLHPTIFSKTPPCPLKLMPPNGAPPHLKMKPPPNWQTTPHWKVKPLSRKSFLEKTLKNWRLSLILVLHS